MTKPKPKKIRCAIYTRKSTEEGLEQEFNSLDAQRESGEAFIKSQAHEGWDCIDTRYDDGGFSGGDTNRPALHRLLRDIKSGKIDVVVVYKVDRLSRSLLDFAKMMELFEEHEVAFVSVTQQFSTTHSMGRLTLNILLSFAQFEREIISERTRDKIAAARRKGKYTGGPALLGYDVIDTKLVPNETEAERVREIFELYLKHQALVPVAKELNRRGWTTKVYTTKKGIQRGGAEYTKTNLHALLKNVVYRGQVRYKEEVHEGEHDGIITVETFQKVQDLLQVNGRSGGAKVRNKYNALLKGKVHCKCCDCAMSHTYTVKQKRRYRYYVCSRAQKLGRGECPAPSIPAPELEKWVVEQLKDLGRDPVLVRDTLAELGREIETRTTRLTAEERGNGRELGRLNAELAAGGDVEEQVVVSERRLAEIGDELAGLASARFDEGAVAQALADFDRLWSAIAPKVQRRVIELLIERVVWDGVASTVALSFRPTGLNFLVKLRGEDGDD